MGCDTKNDGPRLLESHSRLPHTRVPHTSDAARQSGDPERPAPVSFPTRARGQRGTGAKDRLEVEGCQLDEHRWRAGGSTETRWWDAVVVSEERVTTFI